MTTNTDRLNVELGGDNAQLKSFYERILRITKEIEDLQSDRKEIFAEAKGAGFDVKLMKQAIKELKKGEAERKEEESMLPVYIEVLKSTNKV
jgi:uncharacterized protein (UPF0335 family)